MAAAPLPENEAGRLASLQSYAVLDTVCETAFDNIVELAAMMTASPIALVSLIDSDRQWFKARFGLRANQTPREVSFCAHAILTPGKPLIVEDARDDPRFAANPLVTGELGIRFYAGIPLVNGEGAALGTLCVIDREPRTMDAGQRRMLAQLAETVMTTLELRRAMSQVQRFAMQDFLTGLPNRPAMVDALSKAIARQDRHGEPFSLLYFDLDGFKLVNDNLGHTSGDAVLREVAGALRQVTREEDTAARLGGDEFALLIAGDGCHAATVAERFRHEVHTRMETRGWGVTASIGAASFDTVPVSVEEAIAKADGLMYRAKAAGKNRVAAATFTRFAQGLAFVEAGAASKRPLRSHARLPASRLAAGRASAALAAVALPA